MDPRLPVIVGCGELVRHPGRDAAGLEDPASMMAEALRRAARDSGTGDALLARADALAVVPSAAWPHADPGRRVGELLGLAAPTLRSSQQGGNGPQQLVTLLAERIAAGQLDIALVCGAEALASIVHAQRHGFELGWPAPDFDARPGEVVDGERAPASELETAAGMIAPIMAYPLIENAIRHASGAGVDEHLDRIARLWSAFSRVAATRSAAWSPAARSPEELGTPGPANRIVSFPYLKLLNANIQVDQAAGLIVCAAGTAAALGISRDRWVFVHSGADATDHWYLSERAALHRSPAIGACARALLSHAGRAADELGPVDLYSCFPAAVELAAAELDLPLDDPERSLTCTGGLTFFGGPGNNYATHGIAAVVDRLRQADPGTVGLSTALGWYATKHSLGLYGSGPPRRGFSAHRPQAEVDGGPRREVVAPEAGRVTALTTTVIYERDGSPGYGILLADRPDGRRTITNTRDPEAMAAMVSDGFLGATVRLSGDGALALD